MDVGNRQRLRATKAASAAKRCAAETFDCVYVAYKTLLYLVQSFGQSLYLVRSFGGSVRPNALGAHLRWTNLC